MSEIKKLTIGQDELDLSKYSYNTKIDNNSGNSIYKKITITTESNKASDGCLIFGRNQFYLLNLMYASGYMGALHEIGTKANDLKPNVNARYIHLKVKGTADKRETIIYAAMDAYNFISIFSAAKIIVKDSTKSEFDSATTNVTYRYIPNESEIKVKYTGTNLKPTRDTTASWRTLFGNTAGVYFTNYSESNCFTNQPNKYGFLRTIIQGNEVNQMFTTQPDGIIYSRAGNATGWNNSATDTGAFTKITPNNGTLTIQKNGTNVQTFSANQSTNVTANIEVPTKVSDIENDLNFIEDDTTQVCDEGSDIELEGTTKAPLEIKKLEGNIFQQNYTGKNLLELYIDSTNPITKNGIICIYDETEQTLTFDGTCTADNTTFRFSQNSIDFIANVTKASVYYVSGSIETYCTARFYASDYSGLSFHIEGLDLSNPLISHTNGTSYTMPASFGSIRFNKGSVADSFKIKLMVADSEDTTYEPFVGGKASPSPEYPQSISTVTGRNVVEVVGKNLFDVEAIPYVARRAYGSDGAVLSWTDYAGTAEYQPVEPNTQYTLWNNSIGNTTYLCEYDENKNFIQRLIALKTFTTTATTKYLRWSLNVGTGEIPPTQTQLEKGSTATDYTPFSKQTYEINLGKNLLNKEDVVAGALLVDGTMDSTNYPDCRTTGYIAVKPNTAYRVSGRTIWGVQGEYTKDKTFIFRSTGDSFTTGPNTYYVRIVCVNSELGSMQFEAGSVATSYSDYFDPIELCGLGDDGEGGYLYKDSIYRNLENGKWYVRKEVGKIVLDESKEYMSLGDGPNGIKRFRFSHSSIRNIPTSSLGVICDLWRGVAYGDDGISSSQPNTIAIWTSQNMFAITTDSTTYTVADFKTSLATNPATAYYALATPTDTEITNEELISQLRDLWNATGYDDKTEISLLSYGNNSRAILSVCQYPNHIPVASQYKVGSVTVGDGLLVNDGGRISLDMSYIGTSIMKLSNSEIDTIMGVQ